MLTILTADLAKYFKLPTILTTSFENGTNDSLVAELKETFLRRNIFARRGQINAEDYENSKRDGICNPAP